MIARARQTDWPGIASHLALKVLVVLLHVTSVTAEAHQEDNFCVPGTVGSDPALCRAIAALDQAQLGEATTTLEPLTNDDGSIRGFWSTFRLYVGIGVGHILPGGLDHILFVLALCLSSLRVIALLSQITAFTVAHTATLAMAAVGIFAPPASIVEPLIAATIAFVAIENLYFRDMQRWRPVVVFIFGLVHGLGFAGFFGELGLPPNQFWSALLGFNVGVEVGQLSVVAAALAIMIWLRPRLTRRDPERFRRVLVMPASLAIAATGAWWAIERSFF